MSERYRPAASHDADMSVLGGDEFWREAPSLAAGLVEGAPALTSTAAHEELRGDDEANDDNDIVLAYDAAAAHVEMRSDQGVDSLVAWAEVDPRGDIRRAYDLHCKREQVALYQRGAAASRQYTHDHKMAAIETIVDPVERERERSFLLAKERAREAQRGKW